MKRAVQRLNTFMTSLEGHFIIRNNALFIYDKDDKLKLSIPTDILQTPTTSPGLLRQGIRRILA